jgi:hypothetical protein
MTEERSWPGIATLTWSKSGQTQVLHAEGLGTVAQLIGNRGLLTEQMPEGRGLFLELGKVSKEKTLGAVQAIYGEDPGPLPSREEINRRLKNWRDSG